jgi:hypothetical protein
MAWDTEIPSTTNPSSRTNTPAIPVREVTMLSWLRANAEFIWGLLEQGKNCSGNDPPLYSIVCHVWKPPTPASAMDKPLPAAIYDTNLKAAFIARIILFVIGKADTEARTLIENELGTTSIRVNNNTRFACLSLYCKCTTAANPISQQH